MKPIHLPVVLAALLLANVVAQAQTESSPIRGPILGFVFDQPARAIRPILGIPGASTQGEELRLDAALRMAEISPEQNTSIVVTEPEGQVGWLRLDPYSAQIQFIENAVESPDQVVFSASGTAALLIHRQYKHVQIVQGLPEAAIIVADISLDGINDEAPVMALTDDGQVVAIAANETESGALFVWTPDAGLRVVMTGHAGAISFLPHSDDVVIGDGWSRELVLFHDFAGDAQRLVLAGEREGIDKPVAIAFSSDQQTVFVSNAQSQSIVAVDFLGGATRQLMCDCAVSGLARLKGESVFKLNDASFTSPLWLLDAGLSGPRVVFVPTYHNNEVSVP